MTRYTILRDGPDAESFEAPTHQEAWRILAGRLSVGGPRGLVAITDDGAEIGASLYDGEDYIKSRDGRRVALP